MASEGCSIFEQFYPRILEERGLEEDGAQENSVRDVFSSLPQAFRKKLPKVATSRWFQIFDRVESLVCIWHQRLVVLLYMCISAGWIKADGWNGWQQMELATQAPEEKQATGQDTEDMRAMRASCKNTLHFCATMLLEVDNKLQLRGLCQVPGPLREAFGQMLHSCRSCSATLHFYMSECSGQCFTPSLAIAEVMSAAACWAKVGLWIEGDLPAGACSTHPRVLGENELVQKTIHFGMLLVGRRLGQCAWHTLGFPGCFPMLLIPEFAQTALDRLRARWELWEHCIKVRPGSFWGLVRKRSYFNMMVVRQAAYNIHSSVDTYSVPQSFGSACVVACPAGLGFLGACILNNAVALGGGVHCASWCVTAYCRNCVSYYSSTRQIAMIWVANLC